MDVLILQANDTAQRTPDAAGDFVRERATFEARIAQARDQFFTAYESGEGVANAGASFAQLLYEKELYFSLIRGMVESADRNRANIRDGFATIFNLDGGIPADAQPYFDAWCNRVVISMKAGAKANEAELDKQFGTRQAYYERYCVARDCAEFDTRGVQRKPEDYCDMLIARYPKPKTVVERRANAKAILALFGEATVVESGKAVRALPMKNGVCQNVETLKLPNNSTAGAVIRVGMTELLPRESPYALWVAMLGRDEPMKRYAAEIGSGVQRLAAGDDWVAVATEIERRKLAYGEAAVLADATARFEGKPSIPLAANDLSGFVKKITLDGNPQIQTSNALKAKLDELEQLAGSHDALLKTAEVIRKASESNEVNPYATIGSGVNDPYVALTTTLKPVESNNVFYAAWAHFPVGSSAVLAPPAGGQHMQRKFTLKEMTPQHAIIEITTLTFNDGLGRVQRNPAVNVQLEATLREEDHQIWDQQMTPLFYHNERFFLTSTWGLIEEKPEHQPFTFEKLKLDCWVRKMDPAKFLRSKESLLMCNEVPGGLVQFNENGRPVLTLAAFEVAAGKAVVEPTQPPRVVGTPPLSETGPTAPPGRENGQRRGGATPPPSNTKGRSR